MVPLTGCVHRIGVSIDSLIHVVVSREKAGSNPIPSPRKQDDGVHSPSSARSVDRRKAADLPSTDGDEYGETMISSIISHVFGDMIDSAKRNETIVVDTKSITDFLAAEPSVVKTALQTPLLQDILSDISFVRQLLLSNSTIAELIVSNPGLKEFIDRDDKLRELTSAISDTTNFCDFKHLQQMIVQKVEHSIGNQLQFDQSSVFICVPPYP